MSRRLALLALAVGALAAAEIAPFGALQPHENRLLDAFVKRRTPAARWGEVDELKGAAVFLSAPASDFVNGQILYVDGGVLSAMSG